MKGRLVFLLLGLLVLGCGGQVIDQDLLMDLPEGQTVSESLEGMMVRADGSEVVFEAGAEPDYFVFYFSASWCPPCRAYTPKLVDFYEDHHAKGDGASFEVILINEDNNQEEMLAYMREYGMDWVAMNFEDRGTRGVPLNPQRSFPALVIVDNAGNVVDDSARTSRNVIMEKFAKGHLAGAAKG
ncbi:MAG: thioredoxin-like domain-containing protein [Verrucomicrobiota bacterium]